MFVKKTKPLIRISTIIGMYSLALLLDKVTVIYPDPHLHSRREAIHIKQTSYSNNINRDSGIEILEAWMPSIRHHSNQSLLQRTAEGISSSNNVNNALDRTSPTMSEVRDRPITNNHCSTHSSTQ